MGWGQICRGVTIAPHSKVSNLQTKYKLLNFFIKPELPFVVFVIYMHLQVYTKVFYLIMSETQLTTFLLRETYQRCNQFDLRRLNFNLLKTRWIVQGNPNGNCWQELQSCSILLCKNVKVKKNIIIWMFYHRKIINGKHCNEMDARARRIQLAFITCEKKTYFSV